MHNNRRKFLEQLALTGLTPLIPSITKANEDAIFSTDLLKPKNKAGFNLLLWTSSISDKMNPVAEKLKEIGYDGVEVPMGNTENAPYAAFGKFLKSIGLEATCSFGVGSEENPISESSAVREKALDKMKWIIDRANDLDAKLVCGPMHSAFKNFENRPPSEDDYKRSAEVLYKAGEYAKQSGVIFAVEAINRFECFLCNTTNQLSKLISLVNHPNIRPMYDTFHSNLEDKDPVLAISSMKGMLAHVHISENDRGTPGDGHIDFDKAFAALSKINYSGWITIESFSRNDEGFGNAMHIWRTISPEWEVATKGFSLIRRMQTKHKL